MKGGVEMAKRNVQEWADVSIVYLYDCYRKLGMAAEVEDGKNVVLVDEFEERNK